MTPTVNILGLTYKVERVPYILRDEPRIGQLDAEKQEIKILDGLSEVNVELALSQ